jgi:hypothetical protein
MPLAAEISGIRRTVLILLLAAGLAGSYLLSAALGQQARAAQEAQADRIAQQLTATFALLLDAANGPLRSLATLFNGSGRVSAKEFADTVDFIRQQGAPMPGGLGFLVRGEGADCVAAEDCWMVAYSTVAQGLLQPGADLSRFNPTRATIGTALAEEDTLRIGPPFQQAAGDKSSFCAVTIKNTRQFGVLVSRIDYARLVENLTAQWGVAGLALRLAAAFPQGDAMSDYELIYGAAQPPPEAVRSLSTSAEAFGARFRLSWDVLPEFAAGPVAYLPRAVLLAGVALTLLVTLSVWVWFSRTAPKT